MNLDADYVDQLISFLDFAIDSGNYEKRSPKFQVHILKNPLFHPLLDTVLVEALKYFEEPVISVCWAYIDYKSAYEFYEKRGIWHTHKECLTALLYLKNDERIGTEFLDGSFIFPQHHKWIFMDGYEYHRPPIPQTDSRRYTIAANLIEKQYAIDVLDMKNIFTK